MNSTVNMLPSPVPPYLQEGLAESNLKQPHVKFTGKDSIQFSASKGFLEKITPEISDRDLAKMVHQAYTGNDAELLKKIIEHPKLPEAKQRKAAFYFKFLHKELPEIFKGIKTNNPDPMLKNLPLILFAMPLEVVNRIGYHLDFEKPLGMGFLSKTHNSEAEALLLLRHPDLMDRKTKNTKLLMEGLTSINVFTQRVPDTVAKAWQDIGLLTHAFRFWRFDAEGGDTSLMGKFGFGSIDDVEPNPFGKGYHYYAESNIDSMVRSDLDPLTHVIFRRGFLMASHPDKGTLVIRNSSKVFGRDLMKNPAYFTPKALDVDELESFTPTKESLSEKGFENVLSPKLYGQKFSSLLDVSTMGKFMLALVQESDNQKKGETSKKDPSEVAKTGMEIIWNEFTSQSFDKELLFLSEQLMKVKKEYANWKFDNKAFLINPDTMDERFSLKRSPGFQALRDEFKNRVEAGQTLPDLAFTHPEYPPFEPYARLKMTPERVAQLDLLLEDDWDVDQELIDFIQTGVTRHAELVLLKSDDMLDSL